MESRNKMIVYTFPIYIRNKGAWIELHATEPENFDPGFGDEDTISVCSSGADIYNFCKGEFIRVFNDQKCREYPNGLTRNQANALFYKWTGKKWAPNPGGKRGPAKKPKVALSDSQLWEISELSRNGKFSSLQDAFDAVIESGVANLGG
jgi:hypothetical protein